MDAVESPGVAVVESGTEPVKWWYQDGWCEPRADWSVPGAEWAGWEAHYTADVERGKRTTRCLSGWSEFCVSRLHSLDMLRECAWRFGLVALPDPTLHGGGLHVMPPGSALSCHLDYDRHPNPQNSQCLAGMRRAVNLIAFCHPVWGPQWGGEFYIADSWGRPIVTIDPKPGRLVAFETNDLSYHGVMPITGPAERVSVAVYLLALAGPNNTRTRALFMPHRSKA